MLRENSIRGAQRPHTYDYVVLVRTLGGVSPKGPDPLTFLADLGVIQTPEIRDSGVGEGVVPVVAVDEEDRAISHRMVPGKKEPRRVAEARHRGDKTRLPVGLQVLQNSVLRPAWSMFLWVARGT